MKIEKVIKRNETLEDYTKDKIFNAVLKAVVAVSKQENVSHNIDISKIQVIVDDVENKLHLLNVDKVSIEEIQNLVESSLIKHGHDKTAKAYILYRNEQRRKREIKEDMMEEAKKIFVETDKLNANIRNSPSAKMLQLGALISKEYALKKVFSKVFSDAHLKGDNHIHDLDFSLVTINCLQIPATRLLKEGFDNGHGYLRPPKRITSAASLAAILIQSSQNDMFGGQSIPSFETALAPFIFNANDNEIYQAMEALIFNLNTMHSRAGAQVPFSSLNIGLDTSINARKIMKNLLLAYEQGLGKGENPIFPNIIFKVKAGVNRYPEDPNYDIFQLAIRVASRRMNPTFAFMDTSFNKQYESVDYMGCRTRVVSNVNGEETGVGRGNLFFTTLNLPRVAIESKGNMESFWNILNDKMSLIEKQLLERYDVVKNFKVKDIPFVMGEGLYKGSENLSANDTIENAVKQGTLSMGFIGLAETLTFLTGKHHGESKDSLELGLKIIQKMNEFMFDCTKKHKLNFGLFATPAEGLSGRFVKMDFERYGLIKGVTDKEYYTNSFHIPVNFKISAFLKLKIEGNFHKYCPSGHISYIEFSTPPLFNLKAVEKALNSAADSDIGYMGINFPIDYCEDCGYQAVINENYCPICNSHKIKRIRRITGYLSEISNFNSAKKAEENDRFKHL